MPDILNLETRKQYVNEILGDENKRRKAEKLKEFEIFKRRQERYILDKLRSEFSLDTVKNMRKLTSISLTKRIVNEKASIYRTEPERTFANVSDNEQEQIENLYESSMANVKLKRANKYFKLGHQCTIKVLPKNGVIEMKAYYPHQYDVVPMEDDPEQAFAYIINTFNKFEFLTADRNVGQLNDPGRGSSLTAKSDPYIDGQNQSIADADDYKEKAGLRFIVWTADLHFVMDGNGKFIGDVLPNPIGVLPFIDVSEQDKDNEFFDREGSNIVNFDLDLGVLLSDTSNINRMQSYSQAVIVAEEQPKRVQLGPDTILFLQQDSDPAKKDPQFQFVNPSPQLSASMELIDKCINLFLSSEEIDPKTISSKGDGQKFTSGLDRLLAMIDKFEATADDFDLFKGIEQQLFKLLVLWSNVMQGATDGLKPELNLATINQDATLNVKFNRPQVLKTETEQEDSAIKLIDAGLKSRVKAIMELNEIDEDAAKEMLEEIDNEGFTTEQFQDEALEDGSQAIEAESKLAENVRAEDTGR